MDLIYLTLWFGLTLASIWDMRRTQLQSQAILREVQAAGERIEQSAERIAQMTAEVLRRTPAP